MCATQVSKESSKGVTWSIIRKFYSWERIWNKIRYYTWLNLLWNFLTKPDFVAFNYKEKVMLSVKICRRVFKETRFAWMIQSKEEYKKAKDSFDYFIFDSVTIDIFTE
jgi:hypothetical protein|nr:hypothetical protein [uncultured Lachnoclostridium sp.]